MLKGAVSETPEVRPVFIRQVDVHVGRPQHCDGCADLSRELPYRQFRRPVFPDPVRVVRVLCDMRRDVHGQANLLPSALQSRIDRERRYRRGRVFHTRKSAPSNPKIPTTQLPTTPLATCPQLRPTGPGAQSPLLCGCLTSMVGEREFESSCSRFSQGLQIDDLCCLIEHLRFAKRNHGAPVVTDRTISQWPSRRS